MARTPLRAHNLGGTSQNTHAETPSSMPRNDGDPVIDDTAGTLTFLKHWDRFIYFSVGSSGSASGENVARVAASWWVLTTIPHKKRNACAVLPHAREVHNVCEAG